MPELIGIVVLNYNNVSDTMECVDSILNQITDTFKLCIVDNCSTDDSYKQLQQWKMENFSYKRPVQSPIPKELENAPLDQTEQRKNRVKQVHLIKADKNEGYAAGNNIGLKYLKQFNDVAYFWILNNDTVVVADALQRLRKSFDTNMQQQSETTGILAQKILDYRHPTKIQALGGRLKRPIMQSVHIAEGHEDKSEDVLSKYLAEIEYPIGAALFFSRRFLEQSGYMYEGYFLYYEEIDWLKRSLNNNMTLGYCLDSLVYHKEGATTGKSEEISNLSLAYATRNRPLYALRNEMFYFPLTMTYTVLVLTKHLCKGNFKLLKIFLLNLF